MTLDPTARESNFRDSWKKFLVDNVYTLSGIQVTFDKTMAVPKLTGNKEVTRWINVRFGDLHRQHLSAGIVEIFCCTRQDNEGFRLAQLGDTVMGYLSNNTGDGIMRIPFYRSYPTQAWVKIGGIVVQDILESEQLNAEEETKYKILTVISRFASVI